MTLETEALTLNEEYPETWLTALPEIALDRQHPAPECLPSVVVTISQKDTVSGAVLVART